MYRGAITAIVVVSYVTGAAPGDTVVFQTQSELEQFAQSGGKFFKGLEDFEESNVGAGQVAGPLADPLQGNVPNVDINGLGFPSGLAEKNLMIQSNSLGANAPDPSPGSGLAAIGPDTFQVGLPNSKVAANIVPTESLDLILTDPNHSAIGLDLIEITGDMTGTAHITVFNKQNGELLKHSMPIVLGKTFFGVGSDETIGRINIAVSSQSGNPVIVDNIQLWEAQCVGDLDNDGMVGITDFLILLAKWGPCP
jgi:pectate lyase